MSKITLDRDTFKVLAADTRIDILKRLKEHKLTLTDLSQQMEMSPSTIKEHLDRLVEAGLIKGDERGMKWKYYSLTDKGLGILSPDETKVWIMLGTSIMVMLASATMLMGALQPIGYLSATNNANMMDSFQSM
jgi:DNA-binding transcriptional ArsR family regulator